MDNFKTGSLIKEARKEKGLTQKDLSEKLHITDRAVSKWERGICAPDIALLEPLAEILDVSVTELISGERTPQSQTTSASPAPETESAVRKAIGYSRAEIQKKRIIAQNRIILCVLCFAVLVAACAGAFWYKGYFHIIGRYPSPDGSTITTVYNCELGYSGPPESGGFTLSDKGRFRGRNIWPSAEFRNCWWSPNGSYQAVSAYVWGDDWNCEEGKTETFLFLTDYVRNSGVMLDHYIERAARKSGLFPDAAVDASTYDLKMEFEFLQWSQIDSAKMLLYFQYTDINGTFRQGYTWYDYECGTLSGTVESEQTEKGPDPLHALHDATSKFQQEQLP